MNLSYIGGYSRRGGGAEGEKINSAHIDKQSSL